MWLKIVTGVYSAAKAMGLDKKLLGWFKKRIAKQDKKAQALVNAGVYVADKLDQLEEQFPELADGKAE